LGRGAPAERRDCQNTGEAHGRHLVQALAAAGLQLPIVLHVPWLPVLSTGHVVLSPGVHACVHTCRAACMYKWQFMDMHWLGLVQGSYAAPVHGVPPALSMLVWASTFVDEWLLHAARASQKSTASVGRMTES
jgi:hypothetical protein